MLDFVPNHAGPDHEWTEKFPDFFIHGNEALLVSEPKNYSKVKTSSGGTFLHMGGILTIRVGPTQFNSITVIQPCRKQ